MMERFSTGIVISIFAIITVWGISCSGDQDTIPYKVYEKEIDNWHAKRIAELKQKDSWLSLAGLFPIENGRQTFGSDSTNDIIFPPKAPGQIGTVVKQGNKITTKISSRVKVLHDSTNVSNIAMDVGNTILRHDGFLWFIIERRGQYYIRLKDTNHPNFEKFDGIDRFPVSPKWRIKATFVAFEEPRTITIPDIMNESMIDTLHGTLEFTIGRQKYSLMPLNDPQKDEEFFIVFGDKTNGKSTYSGGRYIYIPTPDKNGETYLDFNKSYNPPCVFTQFATCPLPPAQNRLPIKVTAGEKMYHESKIQ